MTDTSKEAVEALASVANGEKGFAYAGINGSKIASTLRALLSERDALAARVERLEEVVSWYEQQRQSALIRANTISATEDPEVLRLCKLYGFGAVMDSASRQWVKIDSSGAFFIGGAVGDTSARAALQEKQDG